MPENEIDVNIRVDTSQARAAVNEFKSELQGLRPPQITRVPGAPPPLPPTYPEFGGMSYASYAVRQRMGGAGGGAGAAIQETGEAAERAGTRAAGAFGPFERILERMAMRLIAVKLIFDAIAAVASVVKSALDWQVLEVQTKNLSTSLDEANRKLGEFQRIAGETGRSVEEVSQLQRSFEMAGESAAQATKDTEMLEQTVVATGANAAELQKNLEAVRFGTASVEQMQELAYYMDNGNVALREQLATIRQIEAELPREEQLENEIYKLQQRQTEELQRSQDAVTGFGEKLGLGDAIVRQMAQGLGTAGATMHIFQRGAEVAQVNLSGVANVMTPILRAGERRLEQETGLSQASIRTLETYGFINSSELMAAFRRQTEDQRRKQEWAHEDQQWQRRWSLTQQLLGAMRELSNNIAQGAGLTEKFAAAQKTAAVEAGRVNQAWQGIGQSITDALNKLNAPGSGGAQGLGNLLTFMATGGQFGRIGIPAPAPGSPKPLQPSSATGAPGQGENLLQQILTVLGKTLQMTEKVFGS